MASWACSWSRIQERGTSTSSTVIRGTLRRASGLAVPACYATQPLGNPLRVSSVNSSSVIPPQAKRPMVPSTRIPRWWVMIRLSVRCSWEEGEGLMGVFWEEVSFWNQVGPGPRRKAPGGWCHWPGSSRMGAFQEVVRACCTASGSRGNGVPRSARSVTLKERWMVSPNSCS